MPTHAFPERGPSSLVQFRCWQMAILVAFVAVAIVDVQSWCRHDPWLISIASGGYATYGLVCWLGWHAASRLEQRLGRIAAVAIYCGAMAVLFLAAVISYLAIEFVHLGGKLF